MQKKAIDADKMLEKINILENYGKNSMSYRYRAGYLQALLHIKKMIVEPDSVIAQIDGDVFINPDMLSTNEGNHHYLLFTDCGVNGFNHYTDAIQYILEYDLAENETIQLFISLHTISSTMNQITSVKEFERDIGYGFCEDISFPNVRTEPTFEPWLCYEVMLESPDKDPEMMGLFSYYKDALKYLREDCERVTEPNSIILVACLHSITKRKHVYTPIKMYVNDIDEYLSRELFGGNRNEKTDS